MITDTPICLCVAVIIIYTYKFVIVCTVLLNISIQCNKSVIISTINNTLIDVRKVIMILQKNLIYSFKKIMNSST